MAKTTIQPTSKVWVWAQTQTNMTMENPPFVDDPPIELPLEVWDFPAMVAQHREHVN